MTFETAFKRLKTKFTNIDATLLEDMAIQITLMDEDCGGTFYAEVKDNNLSVEPYDYIDNDAVLDITRKSLSDILDKKISFDKALTSGEATVVGNIEKFNAFLNSIKAPEKTATKPKKEVKKKK